MEAKKLAKILRKHDLWTAIASPREKRLRGNERANLAGEDLSNLDLSGANLKRANLSGADLSGADLSGADLSAAGLEGANLTSANLAGANLSGSSMEKSVLENANMRGVNLEWVDMRGAILNGADLRNAHMEKAILNDASMIKADLREANMREADLERADLRFANIEGVIFERTNLEGANLEGVVLYSKGESVTTHGPWRGAVKALKTITKPMKLAAFKKAFPDAFEQIKDDIDTGTLDPESARELIEVYSLTWQITKAKWTPKHQRLSPEPNDVLQLNIDLALVTDDPQILKTLEAIRSLSNRSQHPVLKTGLFTVGWVRYSERKKNSIILIEEVQSDLPIVRKGMTDQAFQTQLKERGIDEKLIKEALDVLQPFVEFFYQDAISLIFDIAHEAGMAVEMLSYEQKKPMKSPRSLYEDLPKQMGMKKTESQLLVQDGLGYRGMGKVWSIKPNPAGKRRSKLVIPKTWSRK